MNIREVKDAAINQQQLVWEAPDLVDGRSYTVEKIWNIDERTAMIKYRESNSKGLSEAKVRLTDLAPAVLEQDLYNKA